MVQIEYGEFVVDEMAEAADWYDDQRLGLGDELLAAIEAVIDRIERHPFAFPRVHQETRRVEVIRFPYSVFFRVHAERIIVAVLHGSRDPRTWRARS
ncbi:MAG: type II toxin-antitoxin system RelE/ParE family toxin [Chloroflexi bacterium]|nr:type II toxin-antitoxin system RelE/ParE family toxin [Chloroflexota bacterium]